MSEWVRVFAPATVANLGPGYDVIGLALERPGDTVEACAVSTRGVELLEVTGDDGRLPRVAALNCAGVAAREVVQRIDPNAGLVLKVHKNMPIGSGLGSSSASSVAAAWAANLAFGAPLSKEQVVDACRAGEKLATGSAHADNVLASLFGGIVLIRSYDPFEFVQLPTPDGLAVGVVSPQLEIKTADARGILPAAVPIPDAVKNLGNLAALVSALYEGRLDLLGRAIDDSLVVPYRSQLIRGFDQVKDAAMEAGALGCSISGSGPAMFALAEPELVELIVQQMIRAFERIDIAATGITSAVNPDGAIQLD